MIQFGKDTCGDLDAALRREWLETNGLGGFASSTIVGLNTRRYHGLLVATLRPPVERFALLSKMEETLFIDGQPFDLSANRYPGVVHPQGFRYLKQFRLDPFPVFTYEVEGIEIEKTVFMVHGENSTVVQYEVKKNNHPEFPKNLALEIRPLIAFRDYHSTTHENAAITRRRNAVASSPIKDSFAETLAAAADQYIVSRGDQKTVIAGYHWFSDWGRDTMIALPGLTLPTGKHDVARSILRTFAKHVDEGMLPNRFPDAGEIPEYNTVDATLWFFEAVRSYLAYTGDLEFVSNELYPVFADTISWHVRGTRYGIKVDPSGLLSSGEQGVQLTWMDAKVGDWVVTPRRGKPVEIQALWYNALCIMEDLARKFGDEPGQKRYRNMATVASWSFNRLFWNEKIGCLYDVTNGAPPDPSIRPNQIFAVSLTHSMLSPERAKSVVEKVKEHLLIPYGLRSLAPSDPQYRGRYTGGPAERDGAYHLGTVWPWLMGPFITAYIKVNGSSDGARRQAAEWLVPLKDHLADGGLGHISEILDGDAPQRPCGCMAKAWSVAEILRALVEDVYGLRPMLQPQVPAAQARGATAVRTAVSRQTGMRTGASP